MVQNELKPLNIEESLYRKGLLEQTGEDRMGFKPEVAADLLAFFVNAAEEYGGFYEDDFAPDPSNGINPDP